MTWKKLVGPLWFVFAAGGVFVIVLWLMGRPGFWEFQISSYEKADRISPPKRGGVIFTGSSSIRFWHTLADDMQPLNAINRGFGGSQISQVNEYASRIVIPYHPCAVVLYAGDNDLSWPWSKSPETVLADFKRFVAVIHSALPDTWIYYLSLRPAPLGWTNPKKLQETNRMIEEYSRSQDRVQFVDVGTAMLDGSGQPRRDLFGWDRLHMNARGYSGWTSTVQPLLLSRCEASSH